MRLATAEVPPLGAHVPWSGVDPTPAASEIPRRKAGEKMELFRRKRWQRSKTTAAILKEN